MPEDFLVDPNLTLALALISGIIAQTVAHHLRLPGIVVLLAVGVLLGPDVAGLIHPETLGDVLGSLVGFAVAIILFEGGMNLAVPRIQRAGLPIRLLITLGAAITAVCATLAVRVVMGWDWSLSVLFGTLVTVTGPTVVNPLLRRLRVEKKVATILEAEGVLIDPIGAILAFVALEIVLHPSAGSVLLGLPYLLVRLAFGGVLGAAFGFVVSRILQRKGLIPEELVNVATLSGVLALYQFAEAVLHESGIAAVTLAGITVRYLGTPVERELLEFKEQLTVLMIGMLFVLLAADVRLAQVVDLGVNGLIVVALLVFVVRPLTVFASTARSQLHWKQRAFIAWMGPRGIVAAAVASLFAVELEHAGMDGGPELRALVFLVIAVTVVTAGLTGGVVAWALGLRRPQDQGWVLLGAHALARQLAKVLLEGGEDVVLVDTNPDNCRRAEEDGIRVMHGNGLKETTLGRLELDSRSGVLGLTPNEEVNFLFVQYAHREGPVQRRYVSLRDENHGVTRRMVEEAGARVLFGGDHDVIRWNQRIEGGQASIRILQLGDPAEGAIDPHPYSALIDGRTLPLALRRGQAVAPLGEQVRFRKGDRLAVLVEDAHAEAALAELARRGWRLSAARVPPGEDRQDTQEV